ncbi:hypothetical protein LTR84_004856 [Exophiala bonariae]|uniref:Major facilitator superfamily (MFS) profile domain-containing protein n=1 Tax=Exophiala bonariae TaxID=1690606 RepID=A0AAV9NN26_9EURO|nr:hypothetical protein LTR84_004856 [Exophiala bonariae]
MVSENGRQETGGVDEESAQSVTNEHHGEVGEEKFQREPKRPSHWRLLTSHGLINEEVHSWQYEGSGTELNPYVVTWIEDDPRDPQNFPAPKKWYITAVSALTLFIVTLTSSGYTGGIPSMMEQLQISQELAIAGVSLYVVGFAVGPIFWAPFSEVAGRQLTHLISYFVFAAFNGGVTAAQNIETILVCRFLAGSFGAAGLTNAGAIVADMFAPRDRGLAMTFFAAAPFLGPVLGPITSGFIAQAAGRDGWRWTSALFTVLAVVFWILGMVSVPETYAPVLLSARAKKLSQATGKVYRSHFEVKGTSMTFSDKMKIALTRPWRLLFLEPIVFLLSLYLSIIYAILYLLFAAFPVVYQQTRGWKPGVGGLAFAGVAVGVFASVVLNFWINNRYQKIKNPTPESRLPPAMLGGVAVTTGLFWFSWTNGPSVHWLVSIAASGVFGFGMVLIFLSINNYLVDGYLLYAASVLAGGTVMRSLLASAFPMFTAYMYRRLGIHWASSIPAFLSLACAPLPFIFYFYGARIRKHSWVATHGA